MKRIVDLSAALAAVEHHEPASLTVLELVNAHDARNPTKPVAPHLARWLNAIGDRPAWSITTEQLQALCNEFERAGYSAGYINRQGSALGTAYKWAKRQHLPPTGFRSPTLGLIRLPEPMRVVECSPNEIAALRAGALGHRNQRFALLVNLLLDTGARPSEILERRWDELDLAKREIVLPPDTKTEKPRVLFFTEATASLARRLLPPKTDDFIFTGRGRSPIDFRRAWSSLFASMGRPDLVPYDMRHLAAARLLRAGQTSAIASQVLGHSSLILHRRYGHLETAALRKAQHQSWDDG
jgi:integrase